MSPLCLRICFSNNVFFRGMGYRPAAEPPTWRTRQPLRPAPTLRPVRCIALGVTGARKSLHHDQVMTPWGGRICLQLD